MIRAVLDPNVLISALIGSEVGAPRQLIRAWREGRFKLMVSPILIQEVSTVLARPKFERWSSQGRSAAWVASLAAGGEHREDPDVAPVRIRDPNDEYLIALARGNDIDVLVSGDADLRDADVEGITVLSPAAS